MSTGGDGHALSRNLKVWRRVQAAYFAASSPVRCANVMPSRLHSPVLFVLTALVAGCSGGGSDAPPATAAAPEPEPVQICSPNILADQNIDLPVRAIYSAERHRYIPETMRKLRDQEPLQVVALGDSIIADAFGPQFGASGFNTSTAAGLNGVADFYQGAIWAVVSSLNSTGMWWYQEPTRVEQYAARYMPDLVIIGGISHREDYAAIASVVEQLRTALPAVEIMLASGAVALDAIPEGDQLTIAPDATAHRARLADLAADLGTAFLDTRGSYNQFVADAVAQDPTIDHLYFQRDAIHANTIGKTVLTTITELFFEPAVFCP